MAILKNAPFGKAVVRLTANATLNVADFSVRTGHLMQGTVAVTAGNTHAVGTDTQFRQWFQAGDAVFVQTNSSFGEVLPVESVANDTFMNLASNSTNSNSAVTDWGPAERVEAITVTGAVWSLSNTAVVKRGSNTILDVAGNAEWDLRTMGGFQDDAGATLVANINGTGTLLLEVSKRSVWSKRNP